MFIPAKRIKRDGWDRVVGGEVIVPGTANVFGDFWTSRDVVCAAYKFMIDGFLIDLEHDNVSLGSKAYVVESFIAREGDPTFIPGSWVIYMYINDDDLWSKVLSGEINGFSYEAEVYMQKATLSVDLPDTVQGVTEPSTEDGHVHEFTIFLGDDLRPVSGGTTEVDGHSHTISTHTITDQSEGHVHRYNIVQGVMKDA